MFRRIRPIDFQKNMFLRKGVLKICSKFTGEHPCRSVISIKLPCNFIKIALRHGCSPLNLLHIFRTPMGGCFCIQTLLLSQELHTQIISTLFTVNSRENSLILSQQLHLPIILNFYTCYSSQEFVSEAYLGPCQTPNMKRFAKIVAKTAFSLQVFSQKVRAQLPYKVVNMPRDIFLDLK